MTSVMLASYPELFAAGAIIAGLPFATANTLPEALERMRGQGFPSSPELTALAASSLGQDADPPGVSVWHGTRDKVVDPVNATAIVAQWRGLHGLGDRPGQVDLVAGHRRETWSDPTGRALITRYDVNGMGHGTPLDTRDGDGCGRAGPHMLDAGICSTRHIAASWGLIEEPRARREPAPSSENPGPGHPPLSPAPLPPAPPTGVEAAIEDALRKAGLMR